MVTPTDERLSTALRAAGHRVTSQRLVLFRVLDEIGRHASAEEIARVSSERLPGLSLPTVYATLELFETLGLARRVAARRSRRARAFGAPGGPPAASTPAVPPRSSTRAPTRTRTSPAAAAAGS